MQRRDIIALFYRHFVRDESGLYFIEIGPQRYRVDVEDTAYVVWAAHWICRGNQSEECVCLVLSDDSIEPLDPGTLRIGRNNVPYCRVKNGCFDARFSRSGYYQLAEHVQYDPLRDAYYICLSGRLHSIATEITELHREEQ